MLSSRRHADAGERTISHITAGPLPIVRKENRVTTSDLPPLTFQVTPSDGLIDEPIHVTLRGAQPGQRITIRSRVAGEKSWSTAVDYVAAANGEIDLDRVAPVAGGFTGAGSSGLIWALAPEGGPDGQRIFRDGLDPYTLKLTAEIEGRVVASAAAVRRPIAPDVRIEEIRREGVVANLFLPEGTGPFPTILVVGGSGGGFSDNSAALYASHGYAAVSLAYFGVPTLPAELLNIPLEYVENAIAWMQRHPALNIEQLAVAGVSRGGELALLLASRYPVFKSVIAYVPSGYLWGAISQSLDPSPDAFPSWSYQGAGLPYVGRIRNDAIDLDDEGALVLTPAYLAALADTQRAEAAAIAVERINGPIILIAGEADALWPSAYFSQLIVERLRAHHFAHPVEMYSYEDAGHTIGQPYVPTTVTQGYHGIRKVNIKFGGSPAAIAAAREDSWQRVLAFLAVHVAPAAAVATR
jgi:dienelactone hydrolase